jgi:ribosomal protein S27E
MPMAQIIERVEAHYEAREAPFGKVYEWHPAYLALECDCGEQLILSATSSTITTCARCGANLGVFVHDIQEREGLLPDNVTHPWFYDAPARADQSLRDEAAYPEGSPWRYNDITVDDDG